MRADALGWRRWGDAFAVIVAALIVGGPAFTRDGFMYDYTNHLWLVGVQSDAISAHLRPTYFIHAPEAGGVFQPLFVFYGGTAHAVGGALGALFGDRPLIGYVIGILAAVAAAYGGLLWIARQLGARSWMAHAPAIAYVTSAYLVSNIYGRGDWTEAIATCAIPLLIASGLWIARAPRLRPLPCALFMLAAVLWSGSHNITLAWSTALAVVTFLSLRVIMRRPLVTIRGRVVWLFGLLAIGVGVNAWCLLPNVLYATDTQIGATEVFRWSHSAAFNTPALVFHPLRDTPETNTPGLYVQLPVWLLAWALLAGARLRARAPAQLRRGAAAIALVFAGLLALLMVPAAWNVIPELLKLIQYPMRLHSFAALAVAGLVLCAVLATEHGARDRERRMLGATLVGACAVSLALCVWQLWVPETHAPASYDDARLALTSTSAAPRTWYDKGAFLDAGATAVATPKRMLVLPPERMTSDNVTLTVTPPAGSAPFQTNIAGGPNLVRLGGLIRVGRTAGGLTVARRVDGGNGPVRVSLEATGAPLEIGAIASLVAALAGLLVLLGVARSARRAARDARRGIGAPEGGDGDSAPAVA